MNELEDKLTGKKIKFISVSIDKNKEAWMNWVKENELKGLQLHIAESGNLLKQFNIRGIPRFILLGKKGEIIQSEAYRPTQNEQLYDFIVKLKGL